MKFNNFNDYDESTIISKLSLQEKWFEHGTIKFVQSWIQYHHSDAKNNQCIETNGQIKTKAQCGYI